MFDFHVLVANGVRDFALSSTNFEQSGNEARWSLKAKAMGVRIG